MFETNDSVLLSNFNFGDIANSIAHTLYVRVVVSLRKSVGEKQDEKAGKNRSQFHDTWIRLLKYSILQQNDSIKSKIKIVVDPHHLLVFPIFFKLLFTFRSLLSTCENIIII